MSQPPPRSTLAYVLCRSWKRSLRSSSVVFSFALSAAFENALPRLSPSMAWGVRCGRASRRDQSVRDVLPPSSLRASGCITRAVEDEHVVRICALRDQSNLLGAHRPESRSLTTVTWTRLKARCRRVSPPFFLCNAITPAITGRARRKRGASRTGRGLRPPTAGRSGPSKGRVGSTSVCGLPHRR